MSATTGSKCPVWFNNQIDLQHAGVLLAIPSLLSQGLLTYEAEFELDNVYYPTSSIFLSSDLQAYRKLDCYRFEDHFEI